MKPTPEAEKHPPTATAATAASAAPTVHRMFAGTFRLRRASRSARSSIMAAFVLVLLRSTSQAQSSAMPPPAPDAQASRDQHARSLFEKGREAYGDGRYRDAWAYFHEAYELSGRPELLYNIGQTADRLGQDTDALRAFRMYLDRLPAAQNRHDVENRIHALEERVGASAQPAPENLNEARTTAATPFPSTPRAAPPLPPLRQHNGPSRKGWYFRGALGVGLRSDGVSDSDLSANIFGFGFAGDLACGYAVLPGFVVGGALYLDFATRPTLSIGNQSASLASANLTSIGPFVDWYLNRETSGFHLQGAITLSVLSLSLREGSGLSIANTSATGIGLVVGGGYEWPISGDWSIGVLARLTLAGLTADTTSHGFVSPSLLASVSWF